jgi:hypothetical protein
MWVLSKPALRVGQISLLFGFHNQQWPTEKKISPPQGNVIKVNRIQENMCNVLAPTFSLPAVQEISILSLSSEFASAEFCSQEG